MKYLLVTLTCLLINYNCLKADTGNIKGTEAVKQILQRQFGKKYADKFILTLKADTNSTDTYQTEVRAGKVYITANSPVALCRGAYNFVRQAGEGDISWTGNHIYLPKILPAYTENTISPYKYRYYLNVVTHGYTTPYWQWDRWEKEIDWMAMHGINMPLLSGAHEAILYRVFKKLGLTDKEANAYFTGPAHFPWNRMGNITGVNGPLPKTFFAKQISLNHQILNRVRALKMKPIIPAFAGFVPTGIKRLYPSEEMEELDWAGFPKKFRAHILKPGSPLFIKIGKMYINEWEKEFGKNNFYLADSFNEMEVPLPADSVKADEKLAAYGKAVFRSINEADPNATWVMQGWTFPFQTDSKTGKLFWTPDRLQSLLSQVPDNKLLILDLANDYNHDWWHSEPSWKKYKGFFGKQWLFSFIPNMGGKTPANGILDTYAKLPIEALKYTDKKNLVGFGFAPEGIENNEIVYELIADMAWRSTAINLNTWIADYCRDRYGAYPNALKTAYDAFRKSSYGTFTDHPRFKYQFTPDSKAKASVNNSPEFGNGVKEFLSCKESFKNNELYKADAIELSAQYLSLKVDSLLLAYNNSHNFTELDKALDLLNTIDRLLLSHPNHRLQKWVDLARNFGTTTNEKNYYEANAKQLITIWGDNGEITDYSARMWSGLISDYYVPRLKLYYEAQKSGKKFSLIDWERNWVATPWHSKGQTPFKDPVDEATKLVTEFTAIN